MGKAAHGTYDFTNSYVEYAFGAVSETWLQWRQMWNASAISNGFQGELFLTDASGNVTDTVNIDPFAPGGPRLQDWWSLDDLGPVIVADRWYTIGLHSTIVAGVITSRIRVDGVDIGPISTYADPPGLMERLRVGGVSSNSAGDEVWVAAITLGTTGFGSDDIFAADFASGVFVPPFTTDNSTDGGLLEIVDDRALTLPRPIVRYEGGPPWRLIVTNRDTETLTMLDRLATQRGFVFALNQPATTTGLVPADDPEVNIPAPDPDSPAFLSHNTRFIYGFRRERRAGTSDDPWVCRYAGLVMQLEDVGADAPTSRYTAYDPWGYLMCRPIRTNEGLLAPEGGIIYEDASASDMALDLLANTIAVDGSVYIDASDPYLIEDTDVIPGKTVFDRGLSVGEAWQQLCDTGTIDIYLRPVYDPENRPGILAELVISKQWGEVRYDAVMGWDRAGRSLTDLSRLVDGTRLANRLQAYAGQGGSPVTLQSDADSIAAYGEYWAQMFMVGKQSQVPLVELLALAQLQIRKRGPKSIGFSPAPERSDLSLRDYGIGDYVPVWASRNFREPLGVDYDCLSEESVAISGPPVEGETLTAEITDGGGLPGGCGYLRLYGIPIELDDNGVERPRDLLTASESANSF